MSIATDSPNIRISPQSKVTLKELAKQGGKPMQTVLDEAVEQYRRDKFFQELDASYLRLEERPEEVAERELWETTLGDGLEDD